MAEKLQSGHANYGEPQANLENKERTHYFIEKKEEVGSDS